MPLAEYITVLLPSMLKGLSTTLQIFTYTLVLSLPLGLIVTLFAMSKFFLFRWTANLYIWVLRGTPLMLQLFFVYFGFPAFGIVLDRFPSAVMAFVLNYAAYFAEIYRGGIQSIDRGQYEASKALGLSYAQTMRHIIIPQTVSRIIPPISNETITLVKDTALVTAIGVAELLKSAKDAVNRDVDTTAFFIAAVFYLLFTLVLTFIYKKLEKRYSKHERSAV